MNNASDASQYSERFIESFWRRVDRSGGPDSCWPWSKTLNGSGYGQISVSHSRIDRAHRVAYRIAVGPIPTGLCVLHRCDNRPCCNPAHLWVGTRGENVRDASAKGRMPTGDRHHSHRMPSVVPRGDSHYASKLTEAQVTWARGEIQKGRTYASVARELGVCYTTLHSAVRHRWKHLPGRITEKAKYPERRGAANVRAALTEVQVREMRQLRSSGWKFRELMNRFGCSWDVVSRVVRGKSYQNVV